MHRLAVGEDYHPQPTSTCFLYANPAADTAIRLDLLVLRLRHYPGNPSIADSSAVAPASNGVEVFRGFHSLGSQRFSRALG